MVRDMKHENNLNEKERWLGFYRNYKFFKIMRFENYTLKNLKETYQDCESEFPDHNIVYTNIIVIHLNTGNELQ